MLARVFSVATIGLEAISIEVEVDIASQGLPSFTIVGLPDKAVEESRERVRAAIKNSGADFPAKRITVNLAPADIPKSGPSYDLPIAVGILLGSGQLTADIKNSLFIGELSLDGSLRHTNGILSLALLAKEQKKTAIYVPFVDASEAAIIKNLTIYPVNSIIELFHHLNKTVEILPAKHLSFQQIDTKNFFEFDFNEIKGQEFAKRAIEIAASGGHNLHLKGIPGAGKTMLARAIPGILPKLTEEEAIEVTKIYSITGNIPAGQSLIKNRPFRSPHHTTSRIGLIGGGTHPQPGEISLAHRGVLFLDEFPEFPRNVLEALRQPLEDGIVTISRAQGTVAYPAKFILVAASNPCPCGFFGDPVKKCKCLDGQILRYQKRISGPIVDRIDLHIDVPAVKVDKLTREKEENIDSSQIIQKRVQKARDLQSQRYKKTKIICNADLSTKDIKSFCFLSIDCQIILRQAASQLNLSARSYFRLIKVARTIADLENEKEISPSHLAEALQYRPKEND